jgi:hypothetical protein
MWRRHLACVLFFSVSPDFLIRRTSSKQNSKQKIPNFKQIRKTKKRTALAGLATNKNEI